MYFEPYDIIVVGAGHAGCEAAAAAAKAAEDIVRSGIDIAMNRHNYTPAKKTKEDKASDGKAIQQQGAGASDTKVIQQQDEKSPGAGSGAGMEEQGHEVQQQ